MVQSWYISILHLYTCVYCMLSWYKVLAPIYQTYWVVMPTKEAHHPKSPHDVSLPHDRIVTSMQENIKNPLGTWLTSSQLLNHCYCNFKQDQFLYPKCWAVKPSSNSRPSRKTPPGGSTSNLPRRQWVPCETPGGVWCFLSLVLSRVACGFCSSSDRSAGPRSWAGHHLTWFIGCVWIISEMNLWVVVVSIWNFIFSNPYLGKWKWSIFDFYFFNQQNLRSKDYRLCNSFDTF